MSPPDLSSIDSLLHMTEPGLDKLKKPELISAVKYLQSYIIGREKLMQTYIARFGHLQQQDTSNKAQAKEVPYSSKTSINSNLVTESYSEGNHSTSNNHMPCKQTASNNVVVLRLLEQLSDMTTKCFSLQEELRVNECKLSTEIYALRLQLNEGSKLTHPHENKTRNTNEKSLKPCSGSVDDFASKLKRPETIVNKGTRPTTHSGPKVVTIPTHPKLHSVFVTRFHPETEASEIKESVEDHLNKTVHIKEIPGKNRHYKSYRITSIEATIEELLDPGLWYEDTVILSSAVPAAERPNILKELRPDDDDADSDHE